MPCDAIAMTVAQIESPFLERLIAISSVRERVRAFFEEHPDLNPDRLMVPDPDGEPPRRGYSYYYRTVYVSISEAGTVTVKASRWPKSKMETLARGIKAAMEDEMAQALRLFVARVVEANGGKVVSQEDEADGSYSLVIDDQQG